MAGGFLDHSLYRVFITVSARYNEYSLYGVFIILSIRSIEYSLRRVFVPMSAPYVLSSGGRHGCHRYNECNDKADNKTRNKGPQKHRLAFRSVHKHATWLFSLIPHLPQPPLFPTISTPPHPKPPIASILLPLSTRKAPPPHCPPPSPPPSTPPKQQVKVRVRVPLQWRVWLWLWQWLPLPAPSVTLSPHTCRQQSPVPHLSALP